MITTGMKEHQRVAYESPCFLAEDTLDAKFHWGFLFERIPVTAHLTANIGLE